MFMRGVPVIHNQHSLMRRPLGCSFNWGLPAFFIAMDDWTLEDDSLVGPTAKGSETGKAKQTRVDKAKGKPVVNSVDCEAEKKIVREVKKKGTGKAKPVVEVKKSIGKEKLAGGADESLSGTGRAGSRAKSKRTDKGGPAPAMRKPAACSGSTGTQKQASVPSPAFATGKGVPKPLLVGSVCSGWVSDAQALARMGVPYRVEFLCDSNPSVRRFCEDNVKYNQWIEDAHSPAFYKDAPTVDLFSAGCPCPPYSHAGKKEGSKDPRSSLIVPVLAYIDRARPKTFFLEQLDGWMTNKHSTYNTTLSFLRSLRGGYDGRAYYNIYVQKLNSLDFQMPQNRSRLYVVGIRRSMDTFEFKFPQPEGRRKVDIESVLDPPVPKSIFCVESIPDDVLKTHSAREAFAKAVSKASAKGENPFLEHTILDLKASSAWSHTTVGYLPTLTVARCSQPQSYFDLALNRCLSLAELCRCQGVDISRLNLSRVSDAELGAMCGNAMTIDVVVAVLQEIFICCPGLPS